jgi:hypothetical protein
VPPDPSPPAPCAEHLFQPGHAATARLFLRRGWPATYVAVCVLCGAGVDLVAVLRDDAARRRRR